MNAPSLLAADDFHDLLSELFDYAREHFRDEEYLMKSIGYPELPEQQQAHLNFVETLTLFGLESCQGKPVQRKILDYLTSWLIDHVCGSDMKIKLFLEEAGARK